MTTQDLSPRADNMGMAVSEFDRVLSALAEEPLTPTVAESRAPRQVMGTPHRPGSTVAQLCLASVDDDLLPSVTRRGFLRRR